MTETAIQSRVFPQQQTVEKTVLDVAQSVLGKKWVFTASDSRQAEAIGQSFGLPDVIARLLVARGVSYDRVQAFLNPALKTDLPDPYTLRDMDRAAERIADAVMKGEKAAVFGDYDVDGATSTALLKRYFRGLGQDIRVYIPDRIAEGYGPNIDAIRKLKDDGASLLITADCGITAFDVIGQGTALGLDIVILDHHRAEAQLPDAHAVVNPNRLDDTSGQGHMCAAGVVFLCLVAVNRVLRQRGWFNDARPEPRILQWLDLVALGTVCDVVPLTGVNRAFVAQGLKVMAMRENAGLVALAALNNLTEAPTTFTAGFVFGPRVNAGGRIGTSDLGTRLLSSDDPIEARAIASELHQFNAERKMMEQDVLDAAIQQAESRRDDMVIMVAGDGWHPGVIGIVAARIKEKFNRPACVIAFDDNGVGKASGRSVSQVDLGGAIIAAKQNDLLVAGGGHKMAAGFTVTRDRFEDLRAFVNNHVAQQMDGASYAPEIRLDGVLSVPALTLELAEKLEMLAPYGAGHSEPRFALGGVKIIRATVVGENHVSCFIQDTAGGASVKAIAFRALDTPLGELLLKSGGQPVNIAGQVTINNWQGRRSVNFQISDAAKIW
jgi:single-stranded-DNA-specific exonuclease